MSEIPSPEQYPQQEKLPDSILISEIEVIMESVVRPESKEDLSRIVEVPLLEACEELYDKNIQTLMSSANSKDVEVGYGYIDIDFETLSEENREIALQLGELFDMHGAEPTPCVKLSFPINEHTTVGDVRRMALDAVSKFKPQERIVSKAEREGQRYMETMTEIVEAEESALSEEELETLKNKQDSITSSFLQGEITGEQYDEAMSQADTDKGKIKRKTLVDFMDLLKVLGLGKTVREDTIAHENDHLVAAIQLGVDPTYHLQFLKVKDEEGNETVSLYPGIHFEFPKDMSDEERRRILREILNAPEELSLRDRDQLGGE